jgi:hypothetical protein
MQQMAIEIVEIGATRCVWIDYLFFIQDIVWGLGQDGD